MKSNKICLDFISCKLKDYETFAKILFGQTTAKVNDKQARAMSMNVPLESLLINLNRYFPLGTMSPKVTCSKSTIETLEKDLKHVQS